MFSTLRPQYPSLSNDIYSRPSSNSRDRYLAALAEAKAAEADYLADEAVRREEGALRQRLEEIQLRKRHEQLSRHRQPFESYSHNYGSHDRLALLRQELEAEEVRQATAAREHELEVLRRREFEEAQALALKRRQEEQTLELLTRRRQEEEKRLLALRQEQQIEKARVHQRSLRPAVQFVLEAEKTPQPFPMHSHQHVPSRTPFAPPSVPACPITQFDEVVKLLSGQATRSRDAPKKQANVPSKPVVRFVLDEPKAKPENPSQSSSQKQSTPLVSSGSQAQVPKPTSSINPQLEGRLHEEEANEIRDTIRAIFASLADAATYTSGNADSSAKASSSSAPSSSNNVEEKLVESTRTSSPASSLKEQLQARLRNDESVEIRDTIQAILASLADAAAHASTNPSTSSSATSASSSSAKGKGKENVASKSTNATTEPTSADVLKSMETVHNIEASFLALQSDFVFPSQIDFTPTSSRSPSPTRSLDNEPSTPTSDSTILKLAYTSRNHSVRYFEQTLSALLTQLDDVQSFGNEEVRTLRKEVVGRVKKAIDELEGEIEGRWRSKVAKEARETRETETSVTEPSVVGSFAATELDHSAQNQSSTAEFASDSTEQPAPEVELKSDDLGGQTLLSTVEENQSQDSEQAQVAESETTVDSRMDSSSLPTEATDSESVSSKGDVDGAIQDDSLQQGAAPHKSASYTLASSTSSTAPSLSTSSSVATIRPYDVEAPSELKPVSLDLSENRTPEDSLSGSEEDSEGVDAVLLSTIPLGSEIQTEATRVKSDSDSDWSEVEA